MTLVVAALSRPRRLRSLLALELVSVGLALGLLQAIYAVCDRPRPSEVFERAEIVLAHGWLGRDRVLPERTHGGDHGARGFGLVRRPEAPRRAPRLHRTECGHARRVRRALPGRRRGGCRPRLWERPRRPVARRAGDDPAGSAGGTGFELGPGVAAARLGGHADPTTSRKVARESGAFRSASDDRRRRLRAARRARGSSASRRIRGYSSCASRSGLGRARRCARGSQRPSNTSRRPCSCSTPTANIGRIDRRALRGWQQLVIEDRFGDPSPCLSIGAHNLVNPACCSSRRGEASAIRSPACGSCGDEPRTTAAGRLRGQAGT